MKKRAIAGFVFVLVLTVTGVVSQKLYTYDDNIKPVLSGNCSTICHSWQASFSKLMAQKSGSDFIVDAGKPENSVIIWRLEGKKPNGDSIIRMPKDQDPLSAETIQMFRDWITQGAPESAVGVQERTHTWSQVKRIYKQ